MKLSPKPSLPRPPRTTPLVSSQGARLMLLLARMVSRWDAYCAHWNCGARRRPPRLRYGPVIPRYDMKDVLGGDTYRIRKIL
jgi:hypothetical protein